MTTAPDKREAEDISEHYVNTLCSILESDIADYDDCDKACKCLQALRAALTEAQEELRVCQQDAITLQSSLPAAQAANVCDSCLGDGNPISGKPCICGGSGKMSDAAVYLRHELVKAQSSLTAAEKQRAQDIAIAVMEERLACAAIAGAVGDKKDGGHSLGYRSAGWEIESLIKGRGAHGA